MYRMAKLKELCIPAGEATPEQEQVLTEQPKVSQTFLQSFDCFFTIRVIRVEFDGYLITTNGFSQILLGQIGFSQTIERVKGIWVFLSVQYKELDGVVDCLTTQEKTHADEVFLKRSWAI